MGGLRHLNGNPGEPPPRVGVSLGDSLAGMFAVQGVLAAVHERDVVGSAGAARWSTSRSSSPASRCSRTRRPEYDRLGLVRERSGTPLSGHRAVQPVPLARRQVGRDRGQPRPRLPPALRRDRAGPSWPTTRATRRTPRAAQNEDELDELIGAWAAERDAADLDEVLNAAGVICGPVYSIAGHLRGRALPRPRDARRPPRSRARAGRRAGRRAQAVAHARAASAGPARGRWAATTPRCSAEIDGIDGDDLSDLEASGVV